MPSRRKPPSESTPTPTGRAGGRLSRALRATPDVGAIDAAGSLAVATVGELQAGATVAGRYRLAVPLTTFPAPIRWLAFDERQGRRVTVHLRDGGDVVLERLRGLHERLAKVRHPVIVAAEQVDRGDDGIIFEVSELDGRTVASLMTAVDLPTALRWGLELLHGIDAAHLGGIVHGDIGAHSVVLTAGQDGRLHPRLVGFVVGVVRDEDADGPTPGVSTDVRGVAEFLFKLITGNDVGEEAAMLTPRAGIHVPDGLSAVMVNQLDDPDHNPSALEFATKLEPFVAVVHAAPRSGKDAGERRRQAELHDAFETLELSDDGESVLTTLATELTSVAALSGAEILEWAGGPGAARFEGQEGTQGRWVALARGGDAASVSARPHPRGEALDDELSRLPLALARRFRVLSVPGHAAMNVRLGDRRVVVSVWWPTGSGVAQTESGAAPPPVANPSLFCAELLVAHAVEVWSRITLVQAFVAETGYRTEVLELADEVLMVLGPQGHLRGISRGAAALLGGSSEELMGLLLRDIPSAQPLAAVAAAQTTIHRRPVALNANDWVTVDVRQCLEGSVIRVQPLASEHPSADRMNPAQSASPWDVIVAHDASMLAARRAGEHAANDDLPVYIVGEAGAGRRTLARAIHAASNRRGGPVCVVDCARQPGGAVNAIFGVQAGSDAAAGYGRPTPGRLQLTDGGTLILVNIEQLSESTLERLGGFACTGLYQQEGSSSSRRADVRLVCVQTGVIETASDVCGALLAELGEAFHLIELAPLRERSDALKTLLPALMERRAVFAGRPALLISPTVFADLLAYQWPGNVREVVELLDAWLSLYAPDATMVGTTPAHIRRAISAEP